MLIIRNKKVTNNTGDICLYKDIIYNLFIYLTILSLFNQSVFFIWFVSE